VTAEKASKHIPNRRIKKSPHSGKFIVSSSFSMNLQKKNLSVFLSLHAKHQYNMCNLCNFGAYIRTSLSSGDDVCTRSVVSACAERAPLRHEPVPVPPVDQCLSQSPAVL
jgi:hypothetical protein